MFTLLWTLTSQMQMYDVSGSALSRVFPSLQPNLGGADLRWEKVSFSSSHETEYRWRACISGFLCLEQIHVFVIS